MFKGLPHGCLTIGWLVLQNAGWDGVVEVVVVAGGETYNMTTPVGLMDNVNSLVSFTVAAFSMNTS